MIFFLLTVIPFNKNSLPKIHSVYASAMQQYQPFQQISQPQPQPQPQQQQQQQQQQQLQQQQQQQQPQYQPFQQTSQPQYLPFQQTSQPQYLPFQQITQLQQQQQQQQPQYQPFQPTSQLQQQQQPLQQTSQPQQTKLIQTFKFNKGQIIVELYHGNIINMGLHNYIITNAANSTLKHCGGIAEDIAKAGGDVITNESMAIMQQRNNKPLDTSEVVVTNAGNLNAHRVFHAVGPRDTEEFCFRKLMNTYLNIFNKLQEFNNEYKDHKISISMPFISSGIFNVSIHDSISAFCFALILFAKENNLASSVIIRLVDINDNYIKICNEKLQSISNIN